MADPITISIDASQVDQMLMRKAASLKNLKPLMEQIGLLSERSVKTNFKEGGRPQKWKKSARARKQGGQTLVDRGSAGLMGSISHETKQREVATGTPVLYGPIHHFGGTINAKTSKGLTFKLPDGTWRNVDSVTLPARPFLMYQKEDYRRINALLKKHVDEA